ncbi:hypothetical protein CWU_02765 [Buchnera aphidicola str. JF98 (Acyrthosiphon pisum)]|nr:hypothetical protein CWU_02765 [Buchnera aphidicola str. JF98 (Acyrthosiphon pisum)]
MSKFYIENINLLNSEKKNKILSELNLLLSNYSAEERISWALSHLPPYTNHVIKLRYSVNSIITSYNQKKTGYSCYIN